MFKFQIFKSIILATSLALTLNVSAYTADTFSKLKSVGTATNAKELVNWDITVGYEGLELPAGSGNLEEGETIYQNRCAMCHGDFGEGANRYPMILGSSLEEMQEAAIEGERNVMMRGVNNFWGHAPTLFDMIRRAMPYFAPQSLTVDQTYSVTGYVLMLAEVIDDEGQEINADFIRSIEMPSENIFITDTRPDVLNKRCMKDCYTQEPQIDINKVNLEDDVPKGE